MKSVGVKKSFTKFQVLATIIPKKVIKEVKPFLRLQESEFTNNDSYKQLKKEILRIFGPKPEVAMNRALSRVLTGTPSSLARELVQDVCKHQMSCDCCPGIIAALWKRKLPGNVVARISLCETGRSLVSGPSHHHQPSRRNPPSHPVSSGASRRHQGSWGQGSWKSGKR